MAKHKYLTLIALLISTAHSSAGQETGGSTHGTLITVMGNKQGIVVVTDSMATVVGSNGQSKQLKQPFQKLMPYDEHTVCATAGLLTYGANKNSEPGREILPQLNLQVLGIVQAYRDAIKLDGKAQSMSDALEGLSGALRGRFTVLADLDSYLGHADVEIITNYQLQLRLAGFDVDGEPKIGSLNLTVTRQTWPDGQIHWTAQEFERPKVESIHDALLVRSAGIDHKEKEMLNNPERFTSATIMQDYIKAMERDKGASLSLEYMKKLGHLFKLETGYGERAVGGPDQVATVVKGKKPEFEGIDSFQSIRNVEFHRVLCGPGSGFVINDTIETGDVPTMIFQSCTFIGGEFLLGSSLFLHCTFKNVRLDYDGGDVLFDDDNVIEGNSRIALLHNSGRRPDIAKRLASKFDVFHGGSAFPEADKYNLPSSVPKP